MKQYVFLLALCASLTAGCATQANQSAFDSSTDVARIVERDLGGDRFETKVDAARIVERSLAEKK